MRRSACAVVVTENEEVLYQFAKALPPCSNNVAEYNALLMALETLVGNPRYAYPKIYSDSAVVVHQVSGKWECKSPDLKPFLFSIKLIQANYPFQLILQPRKVLWLPDQLCNRFLDAVDMLENEDMDSVVAYTLE